MASTHKPFRELVKPGSNFEFVGRSRVWAMISIALVLGSIAMLFVNNHVLTSRGSHLNWTIDFKGGTEMRFSFRDTESGERQEVDSATVRTALSNGGFAGAELSPFEWDEEDGTTAKGMLIRTLSFGAVAEENIQIVIDAFNAQFSSKELLSVRWSGDRIFVRSKVAVSDTEVAAFLQGQNLEMKPWSANQKADFATADKSTGEYEAEVGVYGQERQIAKVLEDATGFQAEMIESYAVGARAGAELRNDGAKSLFYAMALIMLYLAFRFDIRYAPGAVAALFHDAILVTGVFAVTWVEVSLTSVAALLTVIGYSVNDTVVIFDRIRENVERLKDKKMARIINISLNETMQRTLLTSITLFVVTLSMNLLGTGVVRDFAFALNVGVVVGVYSSVFVASPIMLYIDTKYYSGRAPAKRSASKKSSSKKSSSKKSSSKDSDK